MLLNAEEIRELIKNKKLVDDYIHLEKQLTPNGFDLTAKNIFAFNASGALDFSNKEREIPEGKEIFPVKKNAQDKFGWWNLKKGTYKIKTNETINLSDNLVALAFSRTSLLRMGAFTQHGVWDVGFSGKGEFILVVDNPKGIKLKQNARIAQLIFSRINTPGMTYNGIYQNKR